MLASPSGATTPVRNGAIVIISHTPVCCDIATVQADGTHYRQLTHLAPQARAVGPSASPDGRHIVFRVDHPNVPLSAFELHVMNSDGTGQRLLFSDPFFSDTTPSYSPDGAWVLFSRCRPDFSACALYRIRPDGTRLHQLTPFSREVLDLFGRYSPGGRQLAFGSLNRGGIQAAVYLSTANGKRVRRLTPPSLFGVVPDWSPDGTRLAIVMCCTSATLSIWRINRDGTGLTQLTHPQGGWNDDAAVWAPAGDWIAYNHVSPDGSHVDLWVMRPDGSAAHLVRRDADPASWSRAS